MKFVLNIDDEKIVWTVEPFREKKRVIFFVANCKILFEDLRADTYKESILILIQLLRR